MKLFCGDCLKVLPTLDAESVHAVITDPPYGINFLSSWTNHHHKIENDADEAIDLFYAKWLPEVKRVLKPNGVIASFAGGGGKKNVCSRASLEVEKHLFLIQTLVWSKGKQDGSFVGLGWRYRPSYETIIVASKTKDDYAFYGKPVSNVIVCKPFIPQEGEHPTQKPVSLMERLLRTHTKEGDVVLDPFMGSGTTGVACLRLNREFIGIEKDAGYFAMGEKRLNEAAAQTKLSGVLDCE